MSKSSKLLRRLEEFVKAQGPMRYTRKIPKDQKEVVFALCRRLVSDMDVRNVYLVDNAEIIAPHVREYVVECAPAQYAYLTVNRDDAHFHDVKGMVWHDRVGIEKVIERVNEF